MGCRDSPDQSGPAAGARGYDHDAAVAGSRYSEWPAFTELDRALHEHLDRITEDIITQGIARDTSEAEEVWRMSL